MSDPDPTRERPRLQPSARPGRRSLADLLFAEPWRFDFFQAVRLLERLHHVEGTVGRDAARREVVRFAVRSSLAFPASAIHDLRRLGAATDSGRAPGAAMTVAFLGLTGPKGVLPLHYTAELAQRVRAGDQVSAAFFDLFNHRLLALFYRAGEKYRVASDEGGGAHRRAFAECLLSLAGLGPAGSPLRDRLPFDDRRLLGQAGLFTHQVRTAEGLAAVIAGTLGIEVVVRQFVPRWVEIGAEFRGRIGGSGAPGAPLGQGFVIGQRYLDVQGKFRLRVGPLSLAEYRQLLPGSPLLREVVELTRLYVGPSLVFDLELILRASDVPRARLDATAGADRPRLGRQTWASAGPRTVDASVIVAAGPWPGG